MIVEEAGETDGVGCTESNLMSNLYSLEPAQKQTQACRCLIFLSMKWLTQSILDLAKTH